MTRMGGFVAIALLTTFFAGHSVQAQNLNFSDLSARLAKIEAQLAIQDDVHQAAFCEGCGCGECGCGNGCGCCGCCDCGDCCGCCDCCNACGCGGGTYAQFEILFLRAHVLEDAAGLGKLSEEYEISPRFVLGFENGCGQGARIRYWHYGHQQNSIDDPALGVRFEWNVLDLEATNRLQFCRTDVVLGGGVRLANTEIMSSPNIDADLIGLTAAVDAETVICCDCCRCSYWSAIYGSRLSILGGDWEGAGNTYIPGPIRDDNVVVTELYGGVEYGCCYRGLDLFSQLKFEVQNWHSDALAANAGTDSIGFVGPGFVIGAGY